VPAKAYSEVQARQRPPECSLQFSVASKALVPRFFRNSGSGRSLACRDIRRKCTCWRCCSWADQEAWKELGSVWLISGGRSSGKRYEPMIWDFILRLPVPRRSGKPRQRRLETKTLVSVTDFPGCVNCFLRNVKDRVLGMLSAGRSPDQACAGSQNDAFPVKSPLGFEKCRSFMVR